MVFVVSKRDLMIKKVLDKNLVIKYLVFLIDYSKRLLISNTIETEFEMVMREYGLFLHRLMNSQNIDKELIETIVNLNIFDENDLSDNRHPFFKAILSQLPIFGKFIPIADSHAKKEKITRMHESLSEILFNIEKYTSQ
jgi:hypothetical protein